MKSGKRTERRGAETSRIAGAVQNAGGGEGGASERKERKGETEGEDGR